MLGEKVIFRPNPTPDLGRFAHCECKVLDRRCGGLCPDNKRGFPYPHDGLKLSVVVLDFSATSLRWAIARHMVFETWSVAFYSLKFMQEIRSPSRFTNERTTILGAAAYPRPNYTRNHWIARISWPRGCSVSLGDWGEVKSSEISLPRVCARICCVLVLFPDLIESSIVMFTSWNAPTIFGIFFFFPSPPGELDLQWRLTWSVALELAFGGN